jgi:Kef-type K+ transport system membrane component KefB
MQWISIVQAQFQHVSWNALSLFGALLIFGLIGGQGIARISWIPRISGYMFVGFLLGPACLGWVTGEIFEVTHIFADVAIALIVYQLGRYVDLRWLATERWLILTILTTSVISFLLVWLSMEAMGVARGTATLAAILAIGTSPAIVIAVMRDTKAEGHITRRLAAMTALNNVLALLAAYTVLPLLAANSVDSIQQFALHTAYSLGGAFLLAYAAYRLMIPLARWLGRRRQQQFVLVIAIIALTVGITHALHLPVLLTMLAFAILSRNLDHRYDLMDLEFGVVSELFIVLLFVTFGTTMPMPKFSLAVIAAVLIMLIRGLAIGVGIFAFSRPTKLSWRQSCMLTLANLPITESALGLIQLSSVYPQITTELLPVLTGAFLIFEMLGPFATQYALMASGESGRT